MLDEKEGMNYEEMMSKMKEENAKKDLEKKRKQEFEEERDKY